MNVNTLDDNNDTVDTAQPLLLSQLSSYKEEEIDVNPELTVEQQREMRTLLRSHAETFAWSIADLSQTHLMKHKIELSDNTPISRPPYRYSKREREIIDDQVQELLQYGIITPSQSEWTSPVVLVGKPDGTKRFCVDYRKLNQSMIKDVYPMPRIDDLISYLSGAKFYSTLDLFSGYYQQAMDEDSKHLTTFITHQGTYKFEVLPFGVKNGPSSFSRLMDCVLAGLRYGSVVCYLDDLIVWGKDFPEHLDRLHTVLDRLGQVGMSLKPSKCKFGYSQVKVLGHIVDANGVYPNPEKIKSVQNFPQPRTVKGVRSFLGLCNFYRKFVEGYAKISKPLVEQTEKNRPFEWTRPREEAFQALKDKLTTAPVLKHFDEDKPVELHCDASSYGLGVVLVQEHEGNMHPIAYASRCLSRSEKNHPIWEQETLAAVYGIAQFRHYLY